MSAGTLMRSGELHKVCFAACTALSLFLGSPSFADSSSKSEEQRRLFQSALVALHRGDVQVYRQIESRLTDYPLYPYLRYEYLRNNLSHLDSGEVHAFLAQFPDTPVADQLRRAWLMQLASRNNWSGYLADYAAPGNDQELRCKHVEALARTGDKEKAWAEMDALWMTAHSLPRGCNPAVDTWRKADQMTREKVVARMELALDKKQTRVVAQLAGYLPKSDKPWVQRWQRMFRSPEAELKHLRADADPFWSGKLFAYGVRRLANIDAESADRYWARRDAFDLTHDQTIRVERAVSLNLAMQRNPEGHKRLATLAGNWPGADRDVRLWRVRGALWQQDWEAVLAALHALSGEEQAQEDWQYWRGRALEALGRKQEAEAFYAIAAQHRSFYGFLAAARLSRPPAIVSEPLGVTEAERVAVEQSPAMQRMRELNELGMRLEARREWRDAITRMNGREVRVVAQMAHDRGLYDQAILALGKTEYLNDLEVRFPTPYRDAVENHAEKRNLDPAFVYAVMRQESAFGEQARSPVGALGLMQLMPATAKRTARSIRERAPSRAELLTAEKNIRIGTAYLSTLLDKYRGNRMFTLAAYNAGPQRVTRWQPSYDAMPADIWVENITFSETREYVQRILAYTAVYEWRLGRSVGPLTHWLDETPPRMLREASGETKESLAQATPPG